MPRPRKVPITKGEKRIVGSGDAMRIEQTLFCGECLRRLKTAITQKPHTSIARTCENIAGHKTGKIYLWVFEGIEIVGFTN